MSLKQRAEEIRDENDENDNTASRVGGFLVDLVDHISGTTDLFPPYIANKTITTAVTTTTYDATVDEAIDTATPKAGITYYLVEGQVFQLVDETLIKGLTVVDQGVMGAGNSTITLSGTGTTGESKFICVFAEDQAGNLSLYTYKGITLS